jgi:endoglucanase
MRYPSRRKPAPPTTAVLKRIVVPLALLTATVASSASPGSRPAGDEEQPRLSAAAISPHVVSRQLTPASGNPLAGREWGVYQGPGDQAWAPYVTSTGRQRELLAKIALRPKAKWFGAWISEAEIGTKVRDYILNATGGDADVLVQMTVFRMKPWEHDACKRLPSATETASYMRWTDNFAAAIGDAQVALILQPDGPFALCAPGGSTAPSRLIRYSAQKFSALPNTSVYIDAGASDWLRDDPVRAARILMPAGVSDVRGFALNSTHYVSTAREIRFGASVVKELARRGVSGKHFVINTSSNGRPFAGYTYTGPNFDNARACQTRTDTKCVTLGIPPTLDVTNPAWGLGSEDRARAARYVDAYLWFGRPWLYMQADPFLMQRALTLARTTPY